MKVYIIHATSFNFKKGLYAPIEALKLNDIEFVFPHEYTNEAKNSKEMIKTCDVVIAEVSYPSTGSGIEMAWANYLDVPIFALHHIDRQYSSSIKMLTNHISSYADIAELQKLIVQIIEKLK